MTDILLKSPANTCIGIAQQAASIAGDMHSAYWSLTEGKQVPVVFIHQAEERLETIRNLLTVLKGTLTKKQGE